MRFKILSVAFSAALSIAFFSVAAVSAAQASNSEMAAAEGRLTAKLGAEKTTLLSPGVYSLNIDSSRDGYLFIPSSYRPDTPAPFLLFLHGNVGNKDQSLARFQTLAEQRGLILLVPDSRKRTWDRIIDRTFGPDLAYIDRALKIAFASTNIDPKHVGISGFSDGASYALALGQTNGDLFTHIAAFSPGSSRPALRTGKPSIFVIHGVQDDVLDIDECSRKIVPALAADGYAVAYYEFQGQHVVAEEGKTLMLGWFTR